jgi:archaellum component FlaC
VIEVAGWYHNMSNADSADVSVVVEQGGITVEKSFEPDDFPVPAIAFVIHSDLEAATDVRIVDEVPDDVPAQDIGFHPKYGADFWRVEDEQIVFEREFEADEEYTTVYGLRAKDTDDIGRFLTEPSVEGVGGEASVSEIIGDEPAESVDDHESVDDGPTDDEPAEPDTSIQLDDPGIEEESTESEPESEPEPDAADDDPEPAEASAGELESAMADVDADAEAAEADGDSTAAEGGSDADGDSASGIGAEEAVEHGNGTAAAVATEDLASALADQLRDGEVADEDLETLRDALGADIEAAAAEAAGDAELPGHVEAKLDKLQADVDEVVAYTGALESFLDDAGTADELIGLQEEFAGLEASVTALSDDLEAVEDDVDEMDDRLDSMADATASLDERVGAIETNVGDLRSDLERMEDGLGEDLAERVADVEDELAEMEDDIETLDNLRQALAGD